MSQPPELPGSQRLKRAAASAGSSAYQGVFEAVGSILIGCGLGFWFDRSFETGPIGVLVGAAIGFGAFVLRLMRLGKELHPDGVAGRAASGADAVAQHEVPARTSAGAAADSGAGRSGGAMGDEDDDLGVGEAPGMSDVLRDDSEGGPERSGRDAGDRFDRGGRVE